MNLISSINGANIININSKFKNFSFRDGYFFVRNGLKRENFVYLHIICVGG